MNANNEQGYKAGKWSDEEVGVRLELIRALQEIADMAETGRQSVSEIVDCRVGSGGAPSRMVDSAASVTRGWFLSLAHHARSAIAKATTTPQ